MKTTIDLPDTLLHQAKVTAARRRTTLKDLVVQGLEHVIRSPVTPTPPSPATLADSALFEIDAFGIPVLKRRGVSVTDALVERIRDQEGI